MAAWEPLLFDCCFAATDVNVVWVAPCDTVPNRPRRNALEAQGSLDSKKSSSSSSALSIALKQLSIYWSVQIQIPPEIKSRIEIHESDCSYK